MRHYHLSRIAALLVGTALFLVPVAPRPALAQAAAQQFSLSIPAQPLPQALSALSADTGLQVFYTSEAAYDLRSNAVSGTLSTDQALAQMLAGTGATARRVGANGITISVAGETAVSGAVAAPDGAIILDTVTINAGGTATEGSMSYSSDAASMARGAESLRDVPQSVTVVTRQAIEDQNLTDMSRVMAKAPGIVANREDNGNPNYYSRGFKINNYQIDQLGTSYDSSFRPDFDMSIYDRVEILRGAEGLFSGSGEPGGSVNLARKRPTADLQSSVALSSGSWSNHRIEADISGPIALDGALRGRLVGAWQDRDFFYAPSDEKKHVLYGILEYDLTPDTVVHAGVSYQKRQGVTWTGGIPGYLDGTLPDLDRGIALTTDWARSDHTVKEIFAGVEHRFSPDWTLRASAMAQDYSADMLWLVMAGPLTADNRFNQISSSYQESGNRSKAVDVSLDGRFDMWGRQHKLLIGADWRQSRARQHGYALDQEVFPAVIGLDNLSDLNLIRPNVTVPFSIWPGYGSTQRGLYARLELEANDSLRFILGGRYGDYEYDSRHERYDDNGNLTQQTRTGYRDTGIFTPYAAAIYDLNKDWSVYASLTDIYKVQASNLAGPPENPTPLDPITGRNFEMGAKGELLGGALATSVAVYRIERKGEATDDLRYPNLPDGTGSSCCYIAQGKIVSQGLDLELSGELSPGWQVFMGYTYNHNKDDDSNQVYSALTPRHMLKLWTSYDLPGAYSRWTLGGGVTVKSRHANSGRFWYNNSTGWEERDYEIRQGGFAVWDAQVQYRIDDQWNLALNVNNVFDKNYFSAIGHPRGSNWYGEPRNAALTLRGRF